ncbi:hypothetical protein XA68_12938 [Ophiocordyceps unilateralis]|uniref:Zn(2)-C6 fungal-type domain-containing protein n=1 Tax=Ophiocordyceps unilateralis TaxID=268505 RepID=A0A2A9PC65_OPHUN|nr:hypothetical protein XA68_12938 [Ophiocordyceps unilateralis]
MLRKATALTYDQSTVLSLVCLARGMGVAGDRPGLPCRSTEEEQRTGEAVAASSSPAATNDLVAAAPPLRPKKNSCSLQPSSTAVCRRLRRHRFLYLRPHHRRRWHVRPAIMSANPVPPPSRHARVLACVLCQHRKIKCDRNFPCANCVKANVSCTPSTPAPARKRRRPNQDLQERLSRCEELLKQYAGAAPPNPPHRGSARSAGPVKPEPEPEPAETEPSTPNGWNPACKMVPDEGGARFMDSYIWASVYEELQAMRDIVETEDPEDASILGSEDLTPDNTTDILFAGDVVTANLDDLQPDPVLSFKLWQLFIDRVNPLTKVIHVPTVQPWVVDAAAGIAGLPLHRQALLFSIYTMAIISLSDLECQQTLGVSRDAALQRFGAGTKAALTRLNFLKNYHMAALQALVLYTYSLQGRYDRHAAWILSGTVVRIAQKMGYHRDGELLNLDPFETEMRRRIWWQIAINDSKFAMLSGLRQTMLPLRWDTKMPLNLNDADMVPGSTESIAAREGPTEMAFCLMFNEIYRFKMQADEANDGSACEAAMLGQDGIADDTGRPQNETFGKFRGRARELEARLMELERRYVDISAGKVHQAALSIRPMVTNKLGEMLVPAREQPEWGTEIFGPKDSLFKVVILGNEQRMDAFDRLGPTGFVWFVKLNFQHDMFAVMVGQLCQRPTGSLADRAWTVAERAYTSHSDLSDMTHRPSALQAQFTLKAWRARERAFLQAGLPLETKPFIQRLRELAPWSQDGVGRSSSAPSSATPPMVTTPRRPTQPPLFQPHPQQQAHPQQQQQAQSQSQAQARNNDADPFLGGYLDMAALDWDILGDVVDGNGSHQLSAAMFGGLGLANMPPMGQTSPTINDGRNPMSF